MRFKKHFWAFILTLVSFNSALPVYAKDNNLSSIEGFASLALNCVHKEYPNKIAHVLNSDNDVLPPRELYPAFYGCFDWHSSVHGHWLLARFSNLYPENKLSLLTIPALKKSITKENIAKEVEYLNGNGRANFERPYGLAWALLLHKELQDWGLANNDAKMMAQIYEPLAIASAQKLKKWLPKLYYPVRVGEHSQTAFGLSFAFDWAINNDKELANLIIERASKYYLNDKNCPINYEPSGEDFLSPCLGEAALMARILNKAEFAKWLKNFLPNIPNNGNTNWLKPAIITDRSDPKLAHLDGLNLSRAWMLRRMFSALPPKDARRIAILAASNEHEEAGLEGVNSGHYEGGHWLGSFAMYLTTGAGLDAQNYVIYPQTTKKTK